MFLDTHLGSVLGQICEKWSMERMSKTASEKVMQKTMSAAEAGVSGGGGGFASHLCKYLVRLLSSTPCYL